MTGFGRCTVLGAVLRGVEAVPVHVEVAVTNGIPAFNIVGMADAAVQEAKERVRVALKSSGYSMPTDRVLVSLAPSDLKKTGAGFDLPIAVGLLVATGQVKPQLVEDALFVGELSLDGGINAIAGLLAYALCARSKGCRLICAHYAEGLIPIDDLAASGLSNLRNLRDGVFNRIVYSSVEPIRRTIDYSDIAGNEFAKRAFQIAAAGNHGLLMIGPPGSGKTMLASRLPTILPPLEEDEKLESALVHSVAGLDVGDIMAGRRPFRTPHHSATGPALIGGGSPIRPGEISLAHNGVLFLDELPEYKPSVLQQLRQPIEQGYVNISRADGCVTFPARFNFVSASNPCPCGFFGDPRKPCTCSERKVREYQSRIGGPLLDRMDMTIDVHRVPPGEVIYRKKGTSTDELRMGVLLGREFASWRRSRETEDGNTKDPVQSCNMSESDQRFFETIASKSNMSGRSIVKTLSVARTIADINQRLEVSRDDLCEALGFRMRDSLGG